MLTTLQCIQCFEFRSVNFPHNDTGLTRRPESFRPDRVGFFQVRAEGLRFMAVKASAVLRNAKEKSANRAGALREEAVFAAGGSFPTPTSF